MFTFCSSPFHGFEVAFHEFSRCGVPFFKAGVLHMNPPMHPTAFCHRSCTTSSAAPSEPRAPKKDQNTSETQRNHVKQCETNTFEPNHRVVSNTSGFRGSMAPPPDVVENGGPVESETTLARPWHARAISNL